MALHAADGSIRIALNTGTDTNQDYAGGKGIYSMSGGWRVNTTDVGPGLYAADGALRGSITDDVAVAPGSGLYTPSGAYRLAVQAANDNPAFTVDIYDQPGVYAKDGSYKVTVTNLA